MYGCSFSQFAALRRPFRALRLTTKWEWPAPFGPWGQALGTACGCFWCSCACFLLAMWKIHGLFYMAFSCMLRWSFAKAAREGALEAWFMSGLQTTKCILFLPKFLWSLLRTHCRLVGFAYPPMTARLAEWLLLQQHSACPPIDISSKLLVKFLALEKGAYPFQRRAWSVCGPNLNYCFL